VKLFLIIILFSFVLSCQKESMKPVSLSNSNIKNKIKNDEYDFSKGETASMSSDEFADLKNQEDDEECSDEEEIEKKLLEKKKAFKLQGETDEDCAVQ
jgi:hypothetical protein